MDERRQSFWRRKPSLKNTATWCFGWIKGGAPLLKTPFSKEQVKEILAAGGRSRSKNLASRLNGAADDYLLRRLLNVAMTNSERRKRFKTIATSCGRLLNALGVTTNEYNRTLEDWQRHNQRRWSLSTMADDDREKWLEANEQFYQHLAQIKSSPLAMAWEIGQELKHEAFCYAIATGGFPDFPPINDGQKHPNYQQAEKLNSIVDGITLLQSLATTRSRIEQLIRTQAENTERRRHSGDPAMNELFKQLIAIWKEHFGKRPTTTVDPDGCNVSGEFVDFVAAVLRATNANLTDEARRFPGIEKALSPKPGAIRERTRSACGKKLTQKNSKKTFGG